jgi:hypothetical protein
LCAAAVGATEPRPMTTLCALFRDNFAASSLDTSRWLPSIGSGGSISQSSGTLTLASGTTAGAETWVLGLQDFTLPCKLAVGLQLSQRIANQSFFIELVSVDPNTGLPDGQDQAAILFDNTTVTQAKHQVTTGGLTPNTSSASTYPTAATAALFEIEATPDDCWFHGTTVIDGITARVNSYRLLLRAPDATKKYRIRLRWANGATAPASSTNALITVLNAAEYQEMAAEIVGGRGTLSPGSGIQLAGPVSISSNQPTIVPSATVGALTSYALNSLASTNAVSIKATAGNLYEIFVNNRGLAACAVNVHNLATAPTVGTTVPLFSIIVPAGEFKLLNFGMYGKRFSAGIAISITAGTTLLDNTPVTAGQVQVSASFI